MCQEIGRTFCKTASFFLCFVSVLSFIVSKTDSDDINDQPCAMVAMIIAWCNSWSNHSLINDGFTDIRGLLGNPFPFFPLFGLKTRLKNKVQKNSTINVFLYHFSSFDAVPEGDLAVLFPFIC